MSKTFPCLIAFLIFAVTTAFAQTDRNGNPVFNSEQISEEKFGGFNLVSGYYTIANNISNKTSSVYVSDNPLVGDYLKFARDLPSNFFVIRRRQNVVLMIMVLQKNESAKTTFTYNIVNPGNGKSMSVPCNVWGEISEKRVDELLKLNVDTAAKVIDLPNNGKGFFFNGIVYRIQSYSKLKAEVIEMVRQITSAEEEAKDPEEHIRKETIGGKLDFNKALESDERAFFMHDNVLYSKKDFAIYLWGKAVATIGISSAINAAKLWEEINRRALTEPEKKALNAGFDSKKE